MIFHVLFPWYILLLMYLTYPLVNFYTWTLKIAIVELFQLLSSNPCQGRSLNLLEGIQSPRRWWRSWSLRGCWAAPAESLGIPGFSVGYGIGSKEENAGDYHQVWSYSNVSPIFKRKNDANPLKARQNHLDEHRRIASWKHFSMDLFLVTNTIPRNRHGIREMMTRTGFGPQFLDRVKWLK